MLRRPWTRSWISRARPGSTFCARWERSRVARRRPHASGNSRRSARAILAQAGIDSVLIGAAALAVHGYPRATQDLDLATYVEPKRLAAVALDLRQEGFSTWAVQSGRRPHVGVNQASLEVERRLANYIAGLFRCAAGGFVAFVGQRQPFAFRREPTFRRLRPVADLRERVGPGFFATCFEFQAFWRNTL